MKWTSRHRLLLPLLLAACGHEPTSPTGPYQIGTETYRSVAVGPDSLLDSFTVAVRRADGHETLAGVTVSAVAETGQLLPPTAISNRDGRALFVWRLPVPSPGITVQASICAGRACVEASHTGP